MVMVILETHIQKKQYGQESDWCKSMAVITMISTILKIVLVMSNLYVAFHYTTFYPLTITVTAIIVMEHNKRQRERTQRHKLDKTKRILSCLGDLDVMVGDGKRGGEDCDDSGGSD